ncbi:MAG: hypothetical protein JXR42_01410 [Gammaproteobacteria bacterium]|nr:hypothetical protein [Gammaproteobacteria bacterium]
MIKTAQKTVGFIIKAFTLICFFLLVFFVSLKYLPPISLQNHRLVQNLISDVFNQPLQIKKVKFGRFGIDPQIKLYGVNVQDKNSKNLLAKINELDINIGLLASIQAAKLKPTSLIIDGAKFDYDFYHKTGQNKKNIWRWFFVQKALYLRNITLNLHTKTKNWHITNLGMQLNNSTSKSQDNWLINVNIKNLSGNLNNWFAENIHIKNIAIDGHYKAKQQQFTLTNLNAKNNDFNLNLSGFCKCSPNKKHTFNLLATYHIYQVKHLTKYYPHTIMSSNLINWLKNSITNGDGIDGNFSLKDGDKLLSKNMLHNVSLKYSPEWPLLDKINGEINFTAHAMHIKADALTGPIPIKNIKASIKNLAHPNLKITGSVITNNKHALSFINSSPLKNSLGNKLHNFKLSGPLTLNLALLIPLDETNTQAKVIGDLYEDHAQLEMPWGIHLDKLIGNIHFTNNKISASKISAILFGKEVSINMRTINADTANTLLHINANGTVMANDLKPYINSQFLDHITGSTKYIFNLNLYENHAINSDTCSLDSDLSGINISMPLPFGKKASDARDLHISAIISPNADGRITVNAKYGNNLLSAFSFEHKNKTLNLDGASITLYEDKISPITDGVIKINGYLPVFNWQDWQYYFNFHGNSHINYKYNLDLNVGLLKILRQNFADNAVQINNNETGFNIAIENSIIAGNMFIPFNYPRSSIIAKIDRLQYQTVNGESISADKIPFMQFIGKNIVYKKHKINSLSFIAIPNKNSVLFNKLKLDGDNINLQAKAKWSFINDAGFSRVAGTLSTTNLGNFLSQFGITKLAQGNGTAQFNLNWPDGLLNFDMTNASGSVYLNFKDGRITHLDKKTEKKIGIGRILNIFSLQSLRNWSHKGFEYDKFYGDLHLNSGNVYTSGLYLKGNVADITMQGQINLQKQLCNLLLTVVPYVTSSLPVIATIAGGPIVGAVTWVANELFEHTVQKAMPYRYKVTGNWNNPQVVHMK